MSAPIAIALSGGVDSLVSAHLLKKAGHDLIGLHFLNGFESHYVPPASAADSSKPHLVENPAAAGYAKLQSNLEKMVAGLQVPVMIFDCAGPFRTRVIDYFRNTYQDGRTPNPCMVCNHRIKFGILLTAARKLGARRLATGHYVRTFNTPDGRIHLRKGRDPHKDQAYFLARLTQEQLAGTAFPLGDMHKTEVIQLAGQQGLHPLATQESQDVCFIGNRGYGTFLAEALGHKSSPGAIEDLSGKQIGRHPGLHLFTVGQRRGINCPARVPYYVHSLDTARNVLKVGSKDDLLSEGCRVEDINWIIPPAAVHMRLHIRLRYRSPVAEGTVVVSGPTSARVQFDTPQSAVSPGQGAVFYLGDEILGGGWIAGTGS